MPNFVSKLPPAGRQVVFPLHSEGANAIPLCHFQPSKFGSSPPILSFLKDLVLASLKQKQSTTTSTLLPIHQLDVCVLPAHILLPRPAFSSHVDAWLSTLHLSFLRSKACMDSNHTPCLSSSHSVHTSRPSLQYLPAPCAVPPWKRRCHPQSLQLQRSTIRTSKQLQLEPANCTVPLYFVFPCCLH